VRAYHDRLPVAAQYGEASSWPIRTTSVSEAVMGETLIGLARQLGMLTVLCRSEIIRIMTRSASSHTEVGSIG
jgi:hypothetical protein